MRFVSCFAAFAAAFLGATASAQDYFPAAMWLMRPAAVEQGEAEPETRTARVNTFLFEQDFTAAAEAVLQSRVELPVMGATRWNRSPATIVFEPGDALVLVGGVGYSRAMFCDRRISFQSRNWLDGRRLRACLVDENLDGAFDRVMWGGAAEGLFTPMFVIGAPNLTVNATYALRQAENPTLITAGAVVTRSALGAYRVAFAVKYEGAPQTLDDMRYTGAEMRPDMSGSDFDASALYFREPDAPLTVNVFGARVEILSVDGETISYRVHRYFDPERPMQIGYSGSMGAEPQRGEGAAPAN